MLAERGDRMSIIVYIPTPFRRFVGNQVYVRAEGGTVAEVLDSLSSQYPPIRHMVYDETDEIPAHISIYVNKQEVHSLQGKETPVSDGDELAVIPAIAGGQVLTPEQVDRYSRHIIMPQVGPVGQRKLIAAKVLVVGAGGCATGCPPDDHHPGGPKADPETAADLQGYCAVKAVRGP